MKKILVETNIPKPPRKTKKVCTVQYLANEILVLNFWDSRVLKARHCFNVNTGEYATLQQGKWTRTAIAEIVGCSDRYFWWGNSHISDIAVKSVYIDKADSEFVINIAGQDHVKDPFNAVYSAEIEYRYNENCKRYNSKAARMRELMNSVPPIDDADAIIEKAFNTAFEHPFIMKDPDTKKYYCTSCDNEVVFDKMVKNRQIDECPHCKKQVEVLKLKKEIKKTVPIGIVQPIDDEKSVIRYCRIWFTIDYQATHTRTSEEIRMILYKRNDTYHPRKGLGIYYNAWGDFQDTNPKSQRWYDCLLIDKGIRQALKDTDYERWANLFETMSAAGYICNYNNLMAWCEAGDIELAEMLFKGRFYELLRETVDRISTWDFKLYVSELSLDADCIEDVFDIDDRQKINRIRDKDGGHLMLRWMQQSEVLDYKISDKLLDWLVSNKLYPDEFDGLHQMTLEQLMNYIERQKKESYKSKSATQVLDQYKDYMRMAEKLHKNTDDAMIYKPRDLRKYHDAYVLEIEKHEAQVKADEYSAKYPEAEAVLGEIRPKFEFAAEDYFITVPSRIVDVVLEGRALHHCVGSTDRYFDRIKCHETYICFLRRAENPDEPFYTIEVEPGGTIRQHRGLYDEEPELDKVKPFLRKWQKEIKRRMKSEDHELAKISKIKREENIRELEAAGNTRVLDGLLEDFMEAI